METNTVDAPTTAETHALLRDVVATLLAELKNGSGDKDKRRQVEEWLKNIGDKFPDFRIELGLREYYLAEAQRLRNDFDTSADLIERLNLGRTIEGFLDKAAEIQKRIGERQA